MFTVQFDEQEYNIMGPDGEEGEAVHYGDIATLVIGAAIYYCHVQDPNDEKPRVMRIDSVTVMPTTMEEVEFQDAPEAAGPVLVGEEEEDEDEDEDGEEDGQAEQDEPRAIEIH